jgi:foldase protein PrsA
LNNAKKTVKPHEEGNFFQKIGKQTFLIAVSIVLVVVLIGGVLFDQLYKRTILTINGDKYNINDLSYYFYNTESTYDYIDQLYGGTGSYWDMTNDTTGLTNRESSGQDAIGAAIYNEVMYREAKANNYTLTDDEKKTVDTDVNNMLTGESTKKIAKQNHYTKKYLTDIFTKTTLAERYHQDQIKKLNIDEAGIKAKINYEDYRQYDVEYLFISTKTTDDKGNSVAMTADQKTAAYDKISSYYDKAKTTEDWSKLLPDTEKDLQYQTTSFKKDDSTFPDDFKTKIMAMENNAVSEITETDNGYYLVRMKNNNSTEAYDSAVDSAIKNAQDEAFSPVYQDILKKYNYKINNKELDKLPMGEITLVK